MRSTKRKRVTAGSDSDDDDDVLPAQHRKRAIDAMESRLTSLMGEVSSLHEALEELRKRHRELEVQNALLLKQQVSNPGFRRSFGGAVVDPSAPIASHGSVSVLASHTHFSYPTILGSTSLGTDVLIKGIRPKTKHGKVTSARNVGEIRGTPNIWGEMEVKENTVPLVDDYSKLALCTDLDIIWDKMFDESEQATAGTTDNDVPLVAGSATGSPHNASKPNHLLSPSPPTAAPPASLSGERYSILTSAAVTSTPSLPATSDCPSSAPSQSLPAACGKGTPILFPSPFMQAEHRYLCKPQTSMQHPGTVTPSGQGDLAPMTSVPQTITAANGIPIIVPPLPQRSSATPAPAVRLPAASPVTCPYSARGSTAGAGSDTASDQQQQPGGQPWWQHPDQVSQGGELCPKLSSGGDCTGVGSAEVAVAVAERQGSTPTAMWMGTPICQHNDGCSAATSGVDGLQPSPAHLPRQHSVQLPEENVGAPATWQSWYCNDGGAATDLTADWSPVVGGQGGNDIALMTSQVTSATGTGKFGVAAPAFATSTGIPNIAAAVALPLMPSQVPPAPCLPAPSSFLASPGSAVVSAFGGPGGQALEAGAEAYPPPLEQCGSNSPGSLSGAIGPRSRFAGRALPPPQGLYSGPSPYAALYVNASPYTAPYPVRYVGGPPGHPGRWRRVPGRLPLPLPAGAGTAGPAALATSPLPVPKHMAAHAPPHAAAFGAQGPLPDPYISAHPGSVGVPSSRLSVVAGQSRSCGV